MKCRVCGNVISGNAKECAVCGTAVNQVTEEELQQKKPFFTKGVQIMFVGLIALYLLFYFVLINLVQIFGPAAEASMALGIVGLIFVIPMFLGVLALVVFQLLYIFKAKVRGFDKAAVKLPFVGFIIHAYIAFFTLFFAIWMAAANFGAEMFFTQFFIIYGLQAIHIWLFFIAEKPKQIFPKKPQQPSEVVPKLDDSKEDLDSYYEASQEEE